MLGGALGIRVNTAAVIGQSHIQTDGDNKKVYGHYSVTIRIDSIHAGHGRRDIEAFLCPFTSMLRSLKGKQRSFDS